jgi:nucleoside-diphosphate-sugar epimerase
MKIFITGSSGFIGSHLAPMLRESNQIHNMTSDLTDHDAVDRELQEFNPDIVVHLAARTEVEKSFYEQISFSEVNYIGSVNLIESSKKCSNLKNFVFASTMEVYGWQPISDEIVTLGKSLTHVAFDENTTPHPNAPYAVAKYAVEKYLEYMNRSQDFPFTAIRQTNAYGRRDNYFFVTEQIITQMLKNPNEIHLGYSDPYRNFIFVNDLLDAWVTVINNYEKCNSGMIFTIGPDQPIKILDYANLIAKKIGWNGQINWNTKPKRHGEIYWLNSNNNLIAKTLGWTPKVTLDDGLDYTIDVWKKNLSA